MKTQSVMNSISTGMLEKTLDTASKTGDSLEMMLRSNMERSVNPSVGGNIDVSV